MNIVYVTVRFPAQSETFAALDVLTLARAGATVSVLAMRAPAPGHKRMIRERGLGDIPIAAATPSRMARGLLYALRHPAAGIRLLCFVLMTTWLKPAHFLRCLALLPSALWCFSQIRALRPDVVHLFWGHFPALVGYLVQEYCPRVVVSHFLGAYDLEYGLGASGPVARRADVVWTHARTNVPHIQALGVSPGGIEVAHRGIDVSASAHSETTTRGHRIIAAGRLIRVKAFDEAIATLVSVRERLPDASLTVAGDGPERTALERLASERGVAEAVTFVGHVSQARLFELLEEARVLVLMSRSPSERLPNVAKEAALRGCVTVTTRTTAIDELFTDGEDAFVVSPGDISAAAEHTLSLLADDDLCARMAARARERILSAFDVRVTMGAYLNTWHALSESKNGLQRHPSDRVEV